MKFLPQKKWAVVQDLRPFGYRIEKAYRPKQMAEILSRPRQLLTVILVDEALAYNQRVADIAEFNKELAVCQERKNH